MSETEYLDILGNKLILKKTLSPGLGRDSRPNHGDVVTISYTAFLEDGTEVEKVDRLSFILGDGDVLQAFDLSVSLSERQEEFEVIADARFAYGEKGRLPDIPPNAKLTFLVKVLDTDDPPDYSSLNITDIIAEADKKRERGNELYRREEFSLAVNSYMKAMRILENAASIPDSEATESKEQLTDIKLKIANNLAASQLKIEAYEAAMESCDIVLLHDPNNVKALFRKGKAASGKGDQVEAMTLLKRALALEPGSKLAAKELAHCRNLWQEECEQKARVCKKMFGKMASSYKSNSQSSGQSLLSGFWSSRFGKLGIVTGGIISIALSIALAAYSVRYNNTDSISSTSTIEPTKLQ